MPERTKADTNLADLVQELDYIDHQSLAGASIGSRAFEELLYRAGLLDDRHFDLPYDVHLETLQTIPEGPAFIALQEWLDEETDVDVDLAWEGAKPMPDEAFDQLTETELDEEVEA